MATVAKFATVQNENGRLVERQIDYYNLDVIISVGYRVKSKQGTMFRQWANRVLKEYILKGYAVNQRFLQIDNKLLQHEQRLLNAEKQIDFIIRKIRQMCEYLRSAGVTKVAMESTSTYWVPVWDILLEGGLELMLVNPFLIKQMPGRKSDVKDAQWIACLLFKGMLRGSMIPSPKICELRTYSRKYTKLQSEKTRSLQKMDRIMVMCGFRISSCMSSLATKSVMNVITALISGETNPEYLEGLVYASIAVKKSGKLRQALTGNLKEYHRIELRWEKEQYDMFERQTSECLDQMNRICKEHYRKDYKRR